MKLLSERLIWARAKAEKTQTEVAGFAGMDQSTYVDLEKGRSKSTSKTAQIAHFLGVNAYWLATGEGEPESTLPAEIIALIESLPPEKQAALLEVIRLMQKP